MKSDLLMGLLGFCWITGVTPGPNNIMLLASGLNFGVRRTVPHLAGVAIGFAIMVLLVGLGVGAVFQAWPALYTALKIAGAAYLLWLAARIAMAGTIEEGEAGARPLTFIEAALFQWVNPKGWVMAIGAVTSYAAIAGFPANMALIAAIFGAIGSVASGLWVVFGVALKGLLGSPRAVRVFNVAMALGLVASLWPVIADLFG